MSVIVMDKTGQIWIYTKGAESHVLPLCDNKNYLINRTQYHVNEFAREGLRTLAIARRKLSKSEFLEFHRELTKANNSLTNRLEEVEVCQKKVETGLELLGATAVEDACKFPGHSQF
jgi:phospholipid-translocating ATPase